jgi:four helix bundle protein
MTAHFSSQTRGGILSSNYQEHLLIPKTLRQLVRASGSVAANWIEADEALSKKNFLMRVKICRKEAKESRLFLRLLDAGTSKRSSTARDNLAAEARELVLIFSSIISKSQ